MTPFAHRSWKKKQHKVLPGVLCATSFFAAFVLNQKFAQFTVYGELEGQMQIPHFPKDVQKNSDQYG